MDFVEDAFPDPSRDHAASQAEIPELGPGDQTVLL
jgi:hypothetical protein